NRHNISICVNKPEITALCRIAPTRHYPKKSVPAAFAEHALLLPRHVTRRAPSFGFGRESVFLWPAKRRACARIMRRGRFLIVPETGCANGWASMLTFFTIRIGSAFCQRH